MRIRRPVATVVVLGAVVGLLSWWPDGRGVREEAVDRPAVATAVEGAGGTWFCAARDLGVEGLTHTVFVTALGERDLEVRFDTFGQEGRGGSETRQVPAGSTVALDVSSLGGAGQSVTVDSSGPAVVEHRVGDPEGADQAPCATLSSDDWYFPVVATTRDATARLTLFNPFASDAAVDIEIASDTNVRVPTELSGIVVPAGTSAVVELGDAVQRRAQFSATVLTRSGRVVAELAQRFDDADATLPVSGVRLVGGSRVSSRRWSFAGGFTDPTVLEQLVVLNPEDEPVEVMVQVVPYGGLDVMPEPFVVDVPARRYLVIDLTKESRVAQVGYHAVEVEAAAGHAVVVARSLDVTGPLGTPDTPMRSRIGRGTTASVGSVVAASRWVVGGLSGSPEDDAVLVHNPGTGIAVVEVRALGSPAEPARLEVPPGDSQLVTGGQLGAGGEPWAVEVASTGSAVVVERLAWFPDLGDFSLQPVVPLVGRPGELEVLG